MSDQWDDLSPTPFPGVIKKDMQAHTNAILKVNTWRDDEVGMLRMLEENGDDVIQHFKRSPRSFTAFCKTFSATVIQSLIEKGINPRAIDRASSDATCLAQALLNQDPGVIGALLQAGCDPYAPYRNDHVLAHSILEWYLMDFPTQFDLLDQMNALDTCLLHDEKFREIMERHPKGVAWMEQKLLGISTAHAGKSHRSMRL